jgi:hypothetical protein
MLFIGLDSQVGDGELGRMERVCDYVNANSHTQFLSLDSREVDLLFFYFYNSSFVRHFITLTRVNSLRIVFTQYQSWLVEHTLLVRKIYKNKK